jgi:hypothetical protein
LQKGIIKSLLIWQRKPLPLQAKQEVRKIAKFVTFGEIMLHLKTPGHDRFFQSPTFDATLGGG